MHSDTFGQKSRTLPRSGGYDKSYGESVKLSGIREVISEVTPGFDGHLYSGFRKFSGGPNSAIIHGHKEVLSVTENLLLRI